MGKYKAKKGHEIETGLKGRSGIVVVAAIILNGTIFILKILVWQYTGSHSMFSESIHSIADMTNQIILAFGIYKSVKHPNQKHPYGFSNLQYISSLISGVAIFCVGTGFSFYHGVSGLITNEPVEDLMWAYVVLGGSFLFESITLTLAIISIRKSAKEIGIPSLEYVVSGQDPCVNVVLFEDSAAVCGCTVAAACIAWIGLNKRLTFFMLLSFSLMISTIALAATNGRLRTDLDAIRHTSSTASDGGTSENTSTDNTENTSTDNTDNTSLIPKINIVWI